MRSALVPALCLLALVATPLTAQEEPSGASGDEGLTISSVFGARLGAFDMINSSNSYDAVFDDPMLQLGVGYELRFNDRWFLAAAIDYGEIDGERVLLTDPPTPTGVEQSLRLVPLHLTAGWAALRSRPWRLLLGVGPTVLRYDVDSESGTEPGGTVSSVCSVRPPGGWSVESSATRRSPASSWERTASSSSSTRTTSAASRPISWSAIGGVTDPAAGGPCSCAASTEPP